MGLDGLGEVRDKGWCRKAAGICRDRSEDSWFDVDSDKELTVVRRVVAECNCGRMESRLQVERLGECGGSLLGYVSKYVDQDNRW